MCRYSFLLKIWPWIWFLLKELSCNSDNFCPISLYVKYDVNQQELSDATEKMQPQIIILRSTNLNDKTGILNKVKLNESALNSDARSLLEKKYQTCNKVQINNWRRRKSVSHSVVVHPETWAEVPVYWTSQRTTLLLKLDSGTCCLGFTVTCQDNTTTHTRLIRTWSHLCCCCRRLKDNFGVLLLFFSFFY